MEKILFLDFDGVLFDTASEAYQVCIHTEAFKNIKLPPNSLETFFLYRAMIGPAWNYYYIMNAIIKSKKCSKLDFKESISSKKFENDFFSTRQKLKKNNYLEWLSLNQAYTFVERLKLSISSNLDIYIITTKDKQTVKDLLDAHKIQYINHNNIFGKESFNLFGSKREIILNILGDREYKAIFVDDLSTHLEKCENIKNLQCIQAGWGYIDYRSKYICTQMEVLKKIKDLGSSCE